MCLFTQNSRKKRRKKLHKYQTTKRTQYYIIIYKKERMWKYKISKTSLTSYPIRIKSYTKLNNSKTLYNFMKFSNKYKRNHKNDFLVSYIGNNIMELCNTYEHIHTWPTPNRIKKKKKKCIRLRWSNGSRKCVVGKRRLYVHYMRPCTERSTYADTK